MGIEGRRGRVLVEVVVPLGKREVMASWWL